MRSPEELIADTQAILELVRETLPVENVNDTRELLENDEWGEALSLICTQLYEYEVEVDQALYDRIAAAGSEMQLPPKEWEMLQELIQGLGR